MLLSSIAYISLATAFPIIGNNLAAPTKDSFYAAPENLSLLNPGEVFNHRQVAPSLGTVLAFRNVTQIAYKTTDGSGGDSHTAGLVFVPLFPSSEPRLLSYQWPEDSNELDCAPSYSLVSSDSPNAINFISEAVISIQFALDQGWHVVVPDHEGPNSAFLAGHVQGRAGLDGIRAANLYLGWSTDTKTVIYGYSGGASATVWMANLHDSYAPEINVVGAVHGGTPIDLVATVDSLDKPNSLFSGFVLGALSGLLRAYPTVNETVWPHFYPSLRNAIISTEQPGYCVGNSVIQLAHIVYHTQMNVDFKTDPSFQYIIGQESLLSNVSTIGVSVPKFPRYIYQADGDEVIPAAPVRQYVQQQCAQGANIQYVPWAGNEHLSLEYLGLPDAYQFMLQAMSGQTPAVTCGTPNNDVLTVQSQALGSIIGDSVARLVQGISSVTSGGVHAQLNPQTPYVKGVTAQSS